MKQLYLFPIAQSNRSKKINGLIEQWVNHIMDSGSTTDGKVTFPISFSNSNTYVSNIDQFFISGIAGLGTISKTVNSITWNWDVRTIEYGGVFAKGY